MKSARLICVYSSGTQRGKHHPCCLGVFHRPCRRPGDATHASGSSAANLSFLRNRAKAIVRKSCKWEAEAGRERTEAAADGRSVEGGLGATAFL